MNTRMQPLRWRARRRVADLRIRLWAQLLPAVAGRAAVVHGVIVVDVTPDQVAAPDAVSNMVAALDLLHDTDPRRFRRLTRYCSAVAITAMVSGRARSNPWTGAIQISSDIAAHRSAGWLALVLVVAGATLRLHRWLPRVRTLDQRAQFRRRERLEALDFVQRLPNAAAWVEVVDQWLGPAPAEALSRLRADLEADLRANETPRWLSRILLREWR